MVAFLWGASRGSVFTVREAIRSGKPAAVVLAGGGAALPSLVGGAWAPCSLGGVAAFRWVPVGGAPGVDDDDAEPRRTALHRIFVLPEGEPVDALMAHISSLSAGERLWFEHGVLAGDTVMVPHEALSDTPAFLAVPRLVCGGSGARRARRPAWASCSSRSMPGLTSSLTTRGRHGGVRSA